MGWVTDFFRTLLWGIGGLAMGISNAIFEVLKTITGINITNYENIWTWWILLWSFGVLFVTARIVSMYVKMLVDDDARERIQMGTVVMRLIPMLLVVGLMPTFLTYFNAGATNFTRQAAYFAGASPDLNISDIIISATSYDGNVADTFLSEEINENGVVQYTLEDVDADINARDEDDTYKFFPSFGSFFLGIAMGTFCGIVLVMIAIEYMKRLFSILMKIFISPIPISSIVDPSSNLFGKWVRSLVGDWVTNFIQVFMLYALLIIVMSDFISSYGVAVQLIAMIAGLMLVLSGVPHLAEFIGGDLSTGGALQQLSNIRLGGGMMASGALAVGGAAVGSAATLGAMAGHGGLKMADNFAQMKTGGLNTGLSLASSGTLSDSLNKIQEQQSGSGTSSQRMSIPSILKSPIEGKSSYVGQSRTGHLLAHADNIMASRIAKSPTVNRLRQAKDSLNTITHLPKNDTTGFPMDRSVSSSQSPSFNGSPTELYSNNQPEAILNDGDSLNSEIGSNATEGLNPSYSLSGQNQSLESGLSDTSPLSDFSNQGYYERGAEHLSNSSTQNVQPQAESQPTLSQNQPTNIKTNSPTTGVYGSPLELRKIRHFNADGNLKNPNSKL